MKHRRSRRSVLGLAGTVLGSATLPVDVYGAARSESSHSIPMGSILPLSGGLETYGRGMDEAVTLAVSHVNEAGGPLGRTVDVVAEDSGSNAGTATDGYERLVDEERVVGFVGAGSTTTSLALAERVADDGVMQVSPSSTGVGLAEAGYDESGAVKYFGRTAWNDVQQGVVMGLAMETHLAADTAAFLYVDNAYGEGLVREARASFDGETLRSVPYSPEASDHASTLDELFRGDPDAIGFVGYPGSGRSVLQTWADGGYGGRWVLSEALGSPDLLRSIPDVVEGMYLPAPAPVSTTGTETFREALGHEPGLFSANAYDALFLLALAVHRAGEASGAAVAQNLGAVSRGPGTAVTVDEFRRATDLLDEGAEINYRGASGPVDLNARLEPVVRFELRRVRDGSPETVEQVPRSFFADETPTPAPSSPTAPPDTATPRPLSPPPTESGPTPTATASPSTPAPTSAAPTPSPDGGTGLSSIQLWASGLVGLLIGFLTGNAESGEITKSALTLLVVLFGGGGLLRLIQSGRGPSSLLVVGTAAVILGILLGIYLRERGITLAPSTDATDPSD